MHFPRLTLYVVLFGFVLLLPNSTHAACPAGYVEAAGPVQPGQSSCVPAADGGLPNPLSASDLPTIIGIVLRSAFGLLGSLALAMFIYGGFLWLTSGGSPERIEKGKNTMIWAVLGVAVAFTAYAVVDFVIGAITSQ